MTVNWDSLLPHLVHDVRAFARKGISNAQLLDRSVGGELAPEAKALLASVIESQRDLNQFITRIGTLSDADRPSAGAPELLDLDYIVLALKVQWKEALAAAAAQFIVGEVPTCKVPAQIQAALSELIDNSLRFRADRPLTITINGTLSEEDVLQLSIADNGPAWNPAYGDKLFRPLERLDVRKGGFGLGLAIARAHVECAGGTICAEATDEGARFTIELPASA